MKFVMTPVGSDLFQDRVHVVVVGDGFCGKTSLLYAFSRDEFPEKYLPTVFETSVTDISINGQPVELQLWDTAGQEEYDRLRPLSYVDAHVIVICYSVSDPDSFNSVTERWLPEVRHFCPRQPVILAANKVDLRPAGNDVTVTSEDRDSPNEYYVSRGRGERVAKEIGAVELIECSAKTRQGVHDVFITATSAVISARRRRHRSDKCCIL